MSAMNVRNAGEIFDAPLDQPDLDVEAFRREFADIIRVADFVLREEGEIVPIIHYTPSTLPNPS